MASRSYSVSSIRTLFSLISNAHPSFVFGSTSLLSFVSDAAAFPGSPTSEGLQL